MPPVGCYGQTRVYCNVPTTPLAHWPFRRQTAERPEVSPEVILMGWPKTQVSSTRFCSILCASRSSSQPMRCLSLRDAQFPLTHDESIPYRIIGSWATRNSLLRSILNLWYPHHSSSDSAILPPCEILPLQLSVLNVTRVQLTRLNIQGCFTLRLLTVLSET